MEYVRLWLHRQEEIVNLVIDGNGHFIWKVSLFRIIFNNEMFKQHMKIIHGNYDGEIMW